MTQNPLTPSGTSYDEPESTMAPQESTYDDTTSVTSVPPTGAGLSTGTTGSSGSTGLTGAGGSASTSTLGSEPQSGGGTSVRDEAASVTSDAAESGRQVAGTAVSEAKDVVAEARSQMTTLLHQLRGEANGQASAQSDRAVQGLRTLGDELRQMASSSGQSGLATDLARQAGDRVHSAAGWLDQRQPSEVLDEVRDFARRRPGTFLAAAAVVGLIGGRLTRGLTAGSGGSSPSGSAGNGQMYGGGYGTMGGTGTAGLDAGIDPIATSRSQSTSVAGDAWTTEGTDYTDGTGYTDGTAYTGGTGYNGGTGYAGGADYAGGTDGDSGIEGLEPPQGQR